MSKRFLACLFTFALIACTASLPEGIARLELVSPDDEVKEVMVELAISDQERMTGLMNREELAENTGMLFVFEDEKVRSFWMKNTHIPLDIFFFDAQNSLVSHTTMQPCKTTDCPFYTSFKPAMYALEMPAGSAESLGIDDGWTLRIADENRK